MFAKYLEPTAAAVTFAQQQKLAGLMVSPYYVGETHRLLTNYGLIQGVYAREILDSRGLPTVECTVWLDSGHVVQASVPSGTSKGKHEALDLRDNDPQHFMGKGVLQAVNNVNTVLASIVVGQDPTKQSSWIRPLPKLMGRPIKATLGPTRPRYSRSRSPKLEQLSLVNLSINTYLISIM